MNTRVNYVDNLRTASVSLLIVYHLSMAYNSWGEAHYIYFERINVFSSIVVFMSPWFMPLLFLLAGIAASFSLKKRGWATFIKERFIRLGIPLLTGIILINPVLSFVADKTHNGYAGNYFEHYSVFFTKFTDLTGYDGGFTLGHFWFLAVLILVSCISCGIISVIDHVSQKDRKVLAVIECLLLLLAVGLFDVSFFGKKIPTYLCLYLVGYYLFSNQGFIEKLVKLKWMFVFVFLLTSVTNAVLFVFIEDYKLLNTICNYASFVSGIPALIILGHEYLDFSSKISSYCSKVSYVFYIVHFPVVVLCQYVISLTGMGSICNFIVSFVISSLITCGLCCLIEKSNYAGVCFGLKKRVTGEIDD